MDTQAEQDALRGVVDLVRTPYVVAVLDALHHGRQPVPTTPAPAERQALEDAVHLLASVGVLAALAGAEVTAEVSHERVLSLTDIGHTVAAIFADLSRNPDANTS